MRAMSPEELTPDERLQEVAELLARGILRLRKRLVIAGKGMRSEPKESAANSLDVGPEMSLTVPTG